MDINRLHFQPFGCIRAGSDKELGLTLWSRYLFLYDFKIQGTDPYLLALKYYCSEAALGGAKFSKFFFFIFYFFEILTQARGRISIFFTNSFGGLAHFNYFCTKIIHYYYEQFRD